ncbi:MAG TPA: energy transducer TonB, partial [Pyrinomonadaceae bacterium]|nr:energy transducer TonB [Pyrinomonadaceae bacterium]
HETLLSSLLNMDTDRDRDGLVGPVRRVKTEMVKLASKDGKVVEGQRIILESVAYDIKGTKIENAYFPIPGAALTGKEVYKYDDKGNIVEMTLTGADGSLMSKEVYAYEFDAFGNWTKMTTSVAVIEGGKISFEPTEVTYRSISYYLDEATLAKMNQAATAPKATPVATTAAPNSTPAQKVAANKPASTPPLPTGGSLVKTNMGASNNALSLPGTAAGERAVVKLDEEPPPPAATPRIPKPLLKPVSGGVLNGRAISLPKPVYPQAAKSTHASGMVVVEVVIDEGGKVVAAKALEGPQVLRQAAVQAAQGARFSPTMLSGQPVKVSGQINYNFTLQQ